MQEAHETAHWLSVSNAQVEREQHACATEAVQRYLTNAELLSQLCQSSADPTALAHDTGPTSLSVHMLTSTVPMITDVGRAWLVGSAQRNAVFDRRMTMFWPSH